MRIVWCGADPCSIDDEILSTLLAIDKKVTLEPIVPTLAHASLFEILNLNRRIAGLLINVEVSGGEEEP